MLVRDVKQKVFMFLSTQATDLTGSVERLDVAMEYQ